MLDYVGDGVTVGGAADQCFEDEQVEGALEHFPFERVSVSDRHRIAEYAPIDDRPGQWLGQHFAQDRRFGSSFVLRSHDDGRCSPGREKAASSSIHLSSLCKV
jgi:hypothetical protein